MGYTEVMSWGPKVHIHKPSIRNYTSDLFIEIYVHISIQTRVFMFCPSLLIFLPVHISHNNVNIILYIHVHGPYSYKVCTV